MAKKTNCREYYKQYYGIDFDESYVVMHTDNDKSNNNIENLLLVPKKLYSKYQMCLQACCGIDGKLGFDFKIHPECGSIHTYNYQMMIKLCEAVIEMDKWVAEKSHRDQMIWEAEKILGKRA